MQFVWDPSLHQPGWVALVFLGAIIGYLFPLSIEFAGYLWRRRLHSAIEGKWNSYHFTYVDGKSTTVHSRVHVKKGIKSTYVASIFLDVESKLVYKANIKREKGHLLFIWKSYHHDETVVSRFPDPLGHYRSKLYGLWLSYDHSQTICSGAILLSREEIPEDQCDAIITKGYDLPSNRRPLTRIKHI